MNEAAYTYQSNQKKSPVFIFVLFILVISFFATYYISNRLASNRVSDQSRATETQITPTAADTPEDDQNPSDPNVPAVEATSMPINPMVQTNSSQISPEECEARGGLCTYDLTCEQFGRVDDGTKCFGVRPNGGDVTCCLSSN